MIVISVFRVAAVAEVPRHLAPIKDQEEESGGTSEEEDDVLQEAWNVRLAELKLACELVRLSDASVDRVHCVSVSI